MSLKKKLKRIWLNSYQGKTKLILLNCITRPFAKYKYVDCRYYILIIHKWGPLTTLLKVAFGPHISILTKYSCCTVIIAWCISYIRFSHGGQCGFWQFLAKWSVFLQCMHMPLRTGLIQVVAQCPKPWYLKHLLEENLSLTLHVLQPMWMGPTLNNWSVILRGRETLMAC